MEAAYLQDASSDMHRKPHPIHHPFVTPSTRVFFSSSTSSRHWTGPREHAARVRPSWSGSLVFQTGTVEGPVDDFGERTHSRPSMGLEYLPTTIERPSHPNGSSKKIHAWIVLGQVIFQLNRKVVCIIYVCNYYHFF